MLLGKKKWRIRATLDRSTVSCPSSESSRDVSDQTSSQLRQCQTAAKGISVCVLRDPWSLTCQGSRSLWHSWPWQALGYTCSAHRWVLPINAQKMHSALPHTKWSGRSCIFFFCSNIILHNFDKLHPLCLSYGIPCASCAVAPVVGHLGFLEHHSHLMRHIQWCLGCAWRLFEGFLAHLFLWQFFAKLLNVETALGLGREVVDPAPPTPKAGPQARSRSRYWSSRGPDT